MAQTSPDLTKAINRENDRLIKANTKELPKYDYPMNVITAAMMQRYARYGGRPENSGRWLHPGWKPGRTKAGRKRYFWVRSAFVRAHSGSQMGTFGPRESHHTAAWLVPCGGRRHQQNAPGELRANKEHINAQKRAAYAARKVSTNEENAINAQKRAAYAVRKGSTNGNDDAKIAAVKDAMTKQVLALPESSQSILRAYTGFTATRVNYTIRNGNITPQVRETIAALDNALANGTMPQDVTLYRNTAPSFLDLGLPKNPTEQELQTIVHGRRPLFLEIEVLPNA